ncbi:MAG: transposase [Myxococcales bacterium]|nr:transposase [Myxococcales bacterium]
MSLKNDHEEGGKRERAVLADGSAIPAELVDQLLKGYRRPEDLTGPNGLLKQLTAALVNRAIEAELSHHPGYNSGQRAPEGQSNRRNGKGRKRLRTDNGEVEVSVPRDREGSFEPQLVAKHQRHFNGFDDKILAMYARGMSVRDIRAHLEEIYGVDVSPDLISKVTDSIVDELRAWQQRPLEAVYLDAIVVKIRDKAGVRNKSIYVAVGLLADGPRMCSACGCRTARARRSGTRSSSSCASEVCATSSCCAPMVSPGSVRPSRPSSRARSPRRASCT